MSRALVQSWARGTRLLAFQEALSELTAEDDPDEDAAVFGGGRDARQAGPSSAGRGGALTSADRAGFNVGMAVLGEDLDTHGIIGKTQLGLAF